MSEVNLEDVITGAVNEARGEPEPLEDAQPEVEAQASDEVVEEPVEASDEATDEAAEGEGGETAEVASPGAAAQAAEAKPQLDEFAQKHGLNPAKDNRIPYSRVQKIVQNAEKKAIEPLQARLSELEPKFQEYEERLTRVGQFEQIMLNKPEEFLQMLNQIPAYNQIFSQLQRIEQPAPQDDMPQPDQELPDGSKVYSLEGLKALNAWNREQAKKEVLSQVNQDLGPIVEERKAMERYQQMIPHVQAQIDEARKWPGFNENEEAIVKALAANQKLSLEGAYRQVVLPHLTTKQDELKATIRKQLLEEMKKAPTTSAPARAGAVKPKPVTGDTSGMSLEQIIQAEVDKIK